MNERFTSELRVAVYTSWRRDMFVTWSERRDNSIQRHVINLETTSEWMERIYVWENVNIKRRRRGVVRQYTTRLELGRVIIIEEEDDDDDDDDEQ